MSSEDKPVSATVDADPGGTVDQSAPDAPTHQDRRDEGIRIKLREAEEQRDAYLERYSRLRDAEVSRRLGQLLTDVRLALTMDGKATSDFTDASGGIDDAAITKYADQVIESHPSLRRGLPNLTGDGQRRLTKDNQIRPAGGGWAALLSGPSTSEG